MHQPGLRAQREPGRIGGRCVGVHLPVSVHLVPGAQILPSVQRVAPMAEHPPSSKQRLLAGQYRPCPQSVALAGMHPPPMEQRLPGAQVRPFGQISAPGMQFDARPPDSPGRQGRSGRFNWGGSIRGKGFSPPERSGRVGSGIGGMRPERVMPFEGGSGLRLPGGRCCLRLPAGGSSRLPCAAAYSPRNTAVKSTSSAPRCRLRNHRDRLDRNAGDILYHLALEPELSRS